MKGIFKKLAIIASCGSIIPAAITLSCCAPEIHPEIGGIVGIDTLKIGESAKYTTQILPIESDQTIVWSTSDSTIAEINPETGELTALKEGEVAVTATSTLYNLTASKSITILGEEKQEEHIEITGPDQVELFDTTNSFFATFAPDPFNPDVFMWSVEDTSVGNVIKQFTSGRVENSLVSYTLGYVTINVTDIAGRGITGSKVVEVIPPTPHSWQEDSWKVIGFYADQGIVSLANAYPEEYAREDLANGKIGNSFVGSTKEILLNNCTHNAIVIGQEHDIVADTLLPATLTFQFAQVLTKDNLETIDTRVYNSKKWYKEYDNTWFTSSTQYSEIRTYLTSTFKDSLQSALGTKIKSVEKTTLIGGSSEAVAHSVENVFIPSVAEIYHNDAIKATDFEWFERKMRTDAEDYALEGSQYEFYAKTINIHDPASSYEPKDVTNYYIDTRKSGVKGASATYCTPVSYWLRSPFINTDETETEFRNFIVLGVEGGAHEQGAISTATPYIQYGVAPCFCL